MGIKKEKKKVFVSSGLPSFTKRKKKAEFWNNTSVTHSDRKMKKTDFLLNEDAKKRPEYYVGRNGNPLEDDVFDALIEGASGTSFEGTIEKISGQRFPDIVAAKYYGVEVKSTKDIANNAKSIKAIMIILEMVILVGRFIFSPLVLSTHHFEEILSQSNLLLHVLKKIYAHGTSHHSIVGISHQKPGYQDLL